MSDFMSQQEINEEKEYLRNLREAGGIGLEEFNKRMKDADLGVRGFTDALESSMNQFKTSMIQFGAGVAEGKLGQAQYNDSLTSGADVVSKFVSKWGPWGEAIGAAIKVLTFGISQVNKFSDALYQSTTDLSKAGLVGQEGMMGVAESARQFGYGLDQLSNLTTLLTNNSNTLAQFGGTAVEGAKRFGMLASEMKPLQEHFMDMNMTVDDINNGMANYIRRETLYGTAQQMTTEQLTAGSAEYLENMSRLSKLTGESADSLAKQEEHANTIDLWLAVQERLKTSGEEGKKLAATRQEVYDRLAGVSLKVADDYANSVSGVIGANESQMQSYMATNGAISQAATSTTMTADAQLELIGSAEKLTDTFQQSQAMLGDNGELFGHYNENLRVGNAFSKNALENDKKALAESGATTDEAMKQHVHMLRMQMSSRDALQDLVKSGIVPVTEAMEFLASVINHIVHPLGTFDEQGNYVSSTELNSRQTTTVKATTGSSKEYYDKMYNTLLDEAKKQGIANPEAIARLGAAQTSLETGYGQHMVGNNAFGIKAQGAGGVNASTQEFINGKMVRMDQKFRSYAKPEDSAADYIAFLKTNPRYAEVLAAKTAEDAIAAQGRTGYATDPNYPNKLGIINKANQGGGVVVNKTADGHEITKNGYIVPTTMDKIKDNSGTLAKGAGWGALGGAAITGLAAGGVMGGLELGGTIGAFLGPVGMAAGAAAGAAVGATAAWYFGGDKLKKVSDESAQKATDATKRTMIDPKAAVDAAAAKLGYSDEDDKTIEEVQTDYLAKISSGIQEIARHSQNQVSATKDQTHVISNTGR